MAVRDFRHIPVIRENESLGVVSIRGVLGYASHPKVLTRAGAEDADMVVGARTGENAGE